MRTIKIIYLTILHCIVIAGTFLYTSDKYTIARMDAPDMQVECSECGHSDELTAYLDKNISKKGKEKW